VSIFGPPSYGDSQPEVGCRVATILVVRPSFRTGN
jgi:hypothetical protein